MNLFFQIKSLQLLTFVMGNQEFVTFNLFFSLTKYLLAPNPYDSINQIDCVLLSSFESKTILLISTAKTL